MEEKNISLTTGEENQTSVAENVKDDVENAINGDSEHHHHHHSEHHHHHHRHHRSSHRKSHGDPSKKQNKFVKFLKRYTSILTNIVACTVSVVLLILFACSRDNVQEPQNIDDSETLQVTQSSVQVETSVYLEKVPLVSQAILTYLSDSNDSTPHEIYKMYGGDGQKLNIGMPLKFSYRLAGLPLGITAEGAVLELSADKDLNSPQIYDLENGGDNIEIYHLMPDTKYYYRLRIMLSSGTEVGTTGEFVTEDAPRILNIDGAVNVRDIGGWETADGKKIKYGLLYRGSELDGAVESSYLLTEKGLEDMLSVLGIRYDMDLRGAHESDKDALGANVLHKFYGTAMYSYIFDGAENEKIRSVFSDLADSGNYPMYMHCTYGVDRTGTVCYLLEALLGVSDADLRREYELSAFTTSYVNSEELAAFRMRISMLDGATTREKVEGYLLSIGVTEAEIASIRSIFLGE